jgi:hypothetical protein
MIVEVDWSREERREKGEERKEERRGVASHMCN